MPLQCLNCGTPNPDEKRFCGDCGALLDVNLGAVKQYLDGNLRREIQATLREDFRDQKLVQLETTEAIAEKLTSWAKLLGFFVGIPIFLTLSLLGLLGFKSYSDISKAIGDATNKISATLQEAQKLKDHADQISAEYAKLDTQLQDTSKLAAQVRELSQKVNRIEEDIKSAPSAKVTENTLRTLRSFQEYMGRLGFKLRNTAPMLVDTAETIPGEGIASFDDDKNTMLLKSESAGDLELVLEAYAEHVLRSQANFTKLNYDWKAGLPFFAAYRGMGAYLTCSFLGDPKVSYRGVTLSGNTQKLSQIGYEEDGIKFWGGLFWDIRRILTQLVADKLVVSVWISMELPQNAAEFPNLFAKRLLDAYKSSSDGKDFEQINAIFQTRGFRV
jgi:F0F1-type ATP synthase membrane subunit b/b'